MTASEEPTATQGSKFEQEEELSALDSDSQEDSDREEIPESPSAMMSSDGGEKKAAEDDANLDPEARIEALQKEADEYLDGWQRARAEFANYKKRVDRQLQQSYQRAAGEILTRQLSVMDDMERALKDRPELPEAQSWSEGIELIYRKLEAILESEGVEPIDAQGEMFDPNLHEALSHEDNDEYKGGQIIEVVQNGYRLGDRILRPAMVRVAK